MILIGAVEECGFCPGPSASLPVWLPLVVAIGGLAVLGALLIVAATLLLAERRVPSWLVPAAAFAFGLGSSLIVVEWTTPEAGLLVIPLLATVVVPAAIPALSRRFDLAGWLLLGAGMPAAAWWSWYVLADLRDPNITYPALPVAFAVAIAVVLAGLAGLAIGSRVPPVPPRPAPTEPDPARVVELATALSERMRVGPIDLPNAIAVGIAVPLGLIAASVAGALRLDPLISGVLGVAVWALAATEAYYHTWPRRLRLAMAAHGFLGSWEMHRFRATTGGPAPTSVEAARRWLRQNPETDANRWARPELLAWVGEIEEAYRMLERITPTTDFERFEQRSLRVLLDIVSGAEPDLPGLAAAAETVGAPQSDERLRAVAALAVARARLLSVQGRDDWQPPLIEAQERIGARSLGLMRADTWLLRLRAFALIGGGVFAIGTLLTWMSGAR